MSGIIRKIKVFSFISLSEDDNKLKQKRRVLRDRILCGVLLSLLLCGFAPVVSGQSKASGDAADKAADSEQREVNGDAATQASTRQTFHFVDVFGEEYETVIDDRAPKNSYIRENFKKNGVMTYADQDFVSRAGVDVSHHQGKIDWEAVKQDGYDFAFLRIGYRGYGQEGKVCLDREFDRNITEAQKAGIEVGVYFFAQAVNEEEVLEEAEFVIEHLKNYSLELPVVYDPESILDDEARTDDVSGEQFTKNTLVFCQRIADAGYEPMIYSNMLWEAFEFEMYKLSAYPFWYADYEPKPQTPYDFRFWQYDSEGRVAGIDGNVDLNIELIPVSKASK